MTIEMPVRVRQGLADRTAGRMTVRRFLLENGLSIVVLGAFIAFWAAQTAVGFYAYNSERRDYGQEEITLGRYLRSPHFGEATAENWESEFLQMAAFVWLTSFLFQKGSPESKDPYKPDDEPPVTSDSPWPVRRGGWVLKLYANSLALAFLLLFLVSFLIHAWSGAHLHSEEQARIGEPGVTMLQFMATSQFWFESFQNWQSEFLAIGAMVVLGIYLRQKGSPESKAVQTPHHENE